MDIQRRLANIIRIGKIAELDSANARVKVEIGNILTAWLPWLTTRAGEDRSWWAPEPGEQVILLSPGGELTQAVVLPAIYQQNYPAPADSENIHRVIYQDGTTVEHDRENKTTKTTWPDDTVIKYDATNHKLTADIKGEAEIITTGDVSATVGGNVTADITGNTDLTIGGNLIAEVTGNTSATITGNLDATVTGNITAQSSAAVSVQAATTIDLTAPNININGILNVTAAINGSADIIANGVSLISHIHTGDDGGNTSPPQ
jgi:phage baseplate assembly protein V